MVLRDIWLKKIFWRRTFEGSLFHLNIFFTKFISLKRDHFSWWKLSLGNRSAANCCPHIILLLGNLIHLFNSLRQAVRSSGNVPFTWLVSSNGLCRHKRTSVSESCLLFFSGCWLHKMKKRLLVLFVMMWVCFDFLNRVSILGFSLRRRNRSNVIIIFSHPLLQSSCFNRCL